MVVGESPFVQPVTSTETRGQLRAVDSEQNHFDDDDDEVENYETGDGRSTRGAHLLRRKARRRRTGRTGHGETESETDALVPWHGPQRCKGIPGDGALLLVGCTCAAPRARRRTHRGCGAPAGASRRRRAGAAAHRPKPRRRQWTQRKTRVLGFAAVVLIIADGAEEEPVRARAGRARRRRRGAGDGGGRRRAAVDPARAGESSGRCHVVRRQRLRASVATRPHIFGDCRHRRGASPGKPNRATRGSAAPGSTVLPFRPHGLLLFTTPTARLPSAAPVVAVDAAPRWLTRTPSVDSSSRSSAPVPRTCAVPLHPSNTNASTDWEHFRVHLPEPHFRRPPLHKRAVHANPVCICVHRPANGRTPLQEGDRRRECDGGEAGQGGWALIPTEFLSSTKPVHRSRQSYHPKWTGASGGRSSSRPARSHTARPANTTHHSASLSHMYKCLQRRSATWSNIAPV